MERNEQTCSKENMLKHEVALSLIEVPQNFQIFKKLLVLDLYNHLDGTWLLLDDLLYRPTRPVLQGQYFFIVFFAV